MLTMIRLGYHSPPMVNFTSPSLRDRRTACSLHSAKNFISSVDDRMFIKIISRPEKVEVYRTCAWERSTASAKECPTWEDGDGYHRRRCCCRTPHRYGIQRSQSRWRRSCREQTQQTWSGKRMGCPANCAPHCRFHGTSNDQALTHSNAV